MTETDQDPFLSRWARRKAATKTRNAEAEDQLTAEQLDEGLDSQAAAPQETEEEAVLSDEELCARYDLPDPENCTEEDQLDGFFDGRVPDRLRQLAMRRIWRLNPLFRFADEMVEYGEDFTDAATVIPDMQTAYKVGKGYLDKLLAEEKDAEAAAADAATELADSELADSEQASNEAEPKAEAELEPDQEPEPENQLAKTDQKNDQPDADAGTVPDLAATAEQLSDSPNPSTEAADHVIRPKRMVFKREQA